MPRGYRCILVAFVGWLSLGAQNPQPKTEAQQAKTATQQQSAATPGTPLRVEIVNQATEPEGYQDPCAGTKRDQQSDLCAQWTAANAARDAATYAYVQLGAAGLGMLGLLATLILTLKAVKAARQSAQAAHDANRPWLEVAIHNHGSLVWDMKNATLKIKVVVKNLGNSPATDVLVSAKLSGESDLPAPEDMRKALGMVEEVLDAWDASGERMGTSIFPNSKEGPKEHLLFFHASQVKAIRKIHPEAHPYYMLAVGVRYRFGERSARTTISYFVRGAEEINYDQPATAKVTLEDSFNGYAT